MEKVSQISTPTSETIETLIGKELYQIWNALCLLIEHKYEMERLWNSGGKQWKYEYKYRRGGKTLCALYAKENGSVRKPCGYVMLKCESELSLRKIKK